MSVLVNQVGFRPVGVKHCAVQGTKDLAFEVIDATTNHVAYSGTMQPAGGDFGDYLSGNFTALQTPGVYYVRAGSGRSYPFCIGENVYDEPMKLILHYFSRQRCGASTTGYLTPCHTEDGIRVDNGRRHDVSGGWHDASDLRKWVSATLYGMVGILRMAQTLDAKAATPAVTEELLWGNRYFLAMQEPSGYVMDHIGGDLFDHSDSNYWSDNILGTDDDRVIQTRPVDDGSQFTFVEIQAMMAAYMKGRDDAYSTRCIEAARRAYAWCLSSIKEYTTSVADKALLASIELYRTTGEEQYKVKAYEMADRILAAQVDARGKTGSPSGFFRTLPGSDSYYSEISRTDGVLVGLAKLIQQFPGENNAKYTAALRSYCNDYLALIATHNAFGLLPYSVHAGDYELGRTAGDYTYRYFMDPDQEWWVGINANIAGKAVGLMLAARVLDDSSLCVLAQRQLDWIFGANPLATATMRGVGYEEPSFSSAFYKDLERPGSEFSPPTPHIPGAVLNGIGGDSRDMPMMIAGGWQTGEYWTPMVGLTLWLLAELAVQ